MATLSILLLSFVFISSWCLTDALRCGSYSDGELCFPDAYQEAYCCGFNDNQCCYYTDVVDIWWFWFLLIFFIVFFTVLIVVLCRRRRLRNGQHGFIVVRGQAGMPGTVVTSNQAQIAQVSAPGMAYPPYYGATAAPPYQAYQDPNQGVPPPYAPTYVPPNAPSFDAQKKP